MKLEVIIGTTTKNDVSFAVICSACGHITNVTVHAPRLSKKRQKVKVSYLTSVAKQAKTAFLHGPTV